MSEPSHSPAEVEEATARIGERLSTLRSERGVRVSELARQAGVSSSMISQIERGQSRPSVGTLFALARVLNVPVDDFFADGQSPGSNDQSAGAPPPGATEEVGNAREAAATGQWSEPAGPARHIVRSGERAAIEIRGGVRWERLTRTALDGVEFLELVYEPGAESDRQSYRHPGMELVLVTEGQMVIELGFERYELNPGDSIAFASSTPHRYVNETDAEARAITTIIHDELSSLDLRDARGSSEDLGDGPAA